MLRGRVFPYNRATQGKIDVEKIGSVLVELAGCVGGTCGHPLEWDCGPSRAFPEWAVLGWVFIAVLLR